MSSLSLPVRRPRRGIWGLAILAAGVVTWFALCELATFGWYAWRESRVPVTDAWTVSWPTSSDAERRGFESFSEREMSDAEKELLRFERGNAASWRAGLNSWTGFFIEWPSDHRLNEMDMTHNPTLCLTGAGLELRKSLPDVNIAVREDYRVSFRAWEFALSGRPVFVYVATRWDRNFGQTDYGAGGIRRRLANFERALAGNRGNPRQTLELVTVGPVTAEQAEKDLREEVSRLFSSSSSPL